MNATVDDPRPALTKLNRDQRAVVESALEGFESRRDVVEWSQSAIIATLGELDDDIFRDICLSRSWLSMLLSDPDRRAYWSPEGTDDLDETTPAAFRQMFVSREVEPAMKRAYRGFRFQANEYVDESLESPDPEEQSNPGMRPALAQLEARQSRELHRILDGFASIDDAVEKLVRLNQATFAEHSSDLVADIVDERHTREYLLASSTSREAREFREWFAARDILPAFNRAARKVAGRSAEQVEHESSQLEEKKL